jgi:L-threonylcarbamoyladenylate synthase
MNEVVSIERDGEAAAREALQRCLAEQGVAIFPSDGLYGLACDPLDGDAIRRINALKGRDPGKPSAVMYFSLGPMRELLSSLSPLTRAAAAELLPGPVTLVVDNPDRRYALACGEDPERLGIRLIEGPLSGVATPILQTSANRSGEDPPGRFEDVPEAIRSEVDVAIDGGELTGSSSTVLDLTEIDAGGEWKILRDGGMPYAEIEDTLTRLDLG